MKRSPRRSEPGNARCEPPARSKDQSPLAGGPAGPPLPAKGGDAVKWCQYAEQAAAARPCRSGDESAAAALLQDLVTEADLPASVLVRLARGFRCRAWANTRR